MDVTSLLNTGAAAASAVEATPQPPSTALEHLAHKREHSSESGIAASASEGLAPSSSMAVPSTQGVSSHRPSLSQEPSHRSRTPWDAGGFSLSLYSPARDDRSVTLVDTAGATATGAPALALPASSPSASRPRPSMHRFSDSRSSFSSAYTNSSSSASSTTNDSVSHSRLSSLSTVSENPPLSSRLAAVSLMEATITKDVAPATLYPHQQRPQQPGEERTMLPRSPGREQSPSDAILIPRAMSQDDEASDQLSANMRLHLHPLHAHNHTNAHGIISRLPGSLLWRHKRAVSAPDFPSVNESCFPTFGPIPEPTPSPSEHSDGTAMDEHDVLSSPERAGRGRLPPTDETGSPESGSGSGSDYSSDLPMQSAYASSSPQRFGTSPMKSETGSHGYYRGPHSGISEHPGSHLYSPPTNRANGPPAVADLPENFEVASVCMYRGDCQTGSQLRKAISHIFGRNKLCTRMIPAGVWVHYCRKHYQRTRYRNGGEYPQRQIALVQEQIRRVQAWSDANTQQGRSPVLKDWSLSVRKREQLRLDTKMAVLGKKRRYCNEDDDPDDVLGDDRAELNGTAVPDWVVEHLGDGYSTVEIMSVVDHLKSDIDEGRLQQIPDIEILPNIVSDLANHVIRGTTPKKSYARRRAGSGVVGGGLMIGGHRRSQSVNTAGLRSDAVPMARRRSQPSSNNFSSAPSVGYFPTRAQYANEQPQTPLEKRQRVDSESTQVDGERKQSYGGRVQLAHRPAFAGIRESHAEGTDYHYMYADEHSSGMQGYGGAIDSYYPPPPPPTAITARAPVSLPPSYEHNCNMHDYEERRNYYERRLNSTSGPNGANGYGILPAPLPRRHGRPSVAQLEESYVMNLTASRRSGAHQRSQSEAGFFHAPPVGSRYSQSGPDMPGPLSFAGPNHDHDEDSPHEPFVPGGHPGRPSHISMRHGSPYDDEWRSGAINSQPPPPRSIAYADANVHGSYKYDNVQLPPLQSIQAPSFLNNAHDLSPRRDYAGPSKHMRHQSSPAVTRMHLANKKVSGCSPTQANSEDK